MKESSLVLLCSDITLKMRNTVSSLMAKHFCKKLNGLPEELVTRNSGQVLVGRAQGKAKDT